MAIQGLKYVKKQAIAIAENTKDDRIRLHALTLLKEVNRDLWDLHTASEVLGRWLEFVQARKVELRKLKQRHGYHEHHHIEGREGYDYKGINSHDENAKF